MTWDLHALFTRHAREIDRLLRRRGHTPDAAADLMQDTFVRVMTAKPATAENPQAYLRQVARNLSTDLRRRERLVPHVSLPDGEMQRIADPAPSAETVIYDRQRLAITEKALHELPEKTRRAFEMHRLGDRTISQAAAELGLSTSRTWTLIRRAYKHLRSRLNDDTV